MKQNRKNFFKWCPQPQSPSQRILKQYGQPILGLATAGVIAVTLIAVSGLFLTQPISPPPILPDESTPTLTPKPTNLTITTLNPTPQPTIDTYLLTPPATTSSGSTPAPTWHIGGIDKGADSSIGVDSNGVVHICYQDNKIDLKYVRLDETGNVTQIVDENPLLDLGNGSYVSGTVHDTSLALDSKGYPHISYYVSRSVDTSIPYRGVNLALLCGNLKYAWWNGTMWNIQTVDSKPLGSGIVGIDSSIALDSNDKPHISYRETPVDDYSNLKYACLIGDNWKIQTVDFEGDVIFRTSIALDSAGNPHISYFDQTNRQLKYASYANTEWSTQIVDEGYMCSTSLKLDSNDNPHISYNRNGLTYASWNGTDWSFQIVDSTAYSYSSLVLDSKDYPHIGYWASGTDNSLYQYAQWNGTSWVITTADTIKASILGIAMDLGPSGFPHICVSYSGMDLTHIWLG